MRAEHTRRGGRHEAEERGALESPEPADEPERKPATAPLVDFLEPGTLKSLNDLYAKLKRNAAD